MGGTNSIFSSSPFCPSPGRSSGAWRPTSQDLPSRKQDFFLDRSGLFMLDSNSNPLQANLPFPLPFSGPDMAPTRSLPSNLSFKVFLLHYFWVCPRDVAGGRVPSRKECKKKVSAPPHRNGAVQTVPPQKGWDGGEKGLFRWGFAGCRLLLLVTSLTAHDIMPCALVRPALSSFWWGGGSSSSWRPPS